MIYQDINEWDSSVWLVYQRSDNHEKLTGKVRFLIIIFQGHIYAMGQTDCIDASLHLMVCFMLAKTYSCSYKSTITALYLLEFI